MKKTNIKNNFKKEETIPSNARKIVWVYKQVKPEFWFVDLIDEKKWFFVFPKNKLTAIDWDEVEAFVKSFRWRDEAVITRVIKRQEHSFIGTFQEQKGFWFVLVDSWVLKNDIFVAWTNSKKAITWDQVLVKITKWEKKNPEWKILEILPKLEWNKADLYKILVESWLKLWFPDKVLEEVEKIPLKAKDFEIKRRKDFRNLFTVTIDSISAKDLDDAISIEKLANWNHKLYVHIADVSHYVWENSPTDREALNRSTSTYYPSGVIPMIPEKLSNGLCSLNPNEDKLTLTACMEVGKTWEIITCEVYESVIKSNYRITYDEVYFLLWNKWENLELQDDISQKQEDKNLLEFLHTANELKQIIEKRKKMMWVLDFDFAETKIVVDNKFNPIKIEKYERNFAHKIIEEFMILANEWVWKKFSPTPFLYRVHELPDFEDIEKLQNVLNIFWIKTQISGELSPKTVQKILDEVKLHERWEIISKFVLRTMQKAKYSPDNQGHFWLALDYYSHFTSPIRRYPDLQIHRIIKEKLNKKLTRERIKHYKILLPEVAQITSEKEEKSEKIEYKINDYLKAKFVEDKIWEKFSWNISWIISAWIFVELSNYVEWFVRFESMKWMWTYDSIMMEAIEQKSWKILKLWDKLDVIIDDVKALEWKVDLKIV